MVLNLENKMTFSIDKKIHKYICIYNKAQLCIKCMYLFSFYTLYVILHVSLTTEKINETPDILHFNRITPKQGIKYKVNRLAV